MITPGLETMARGLVRAGKGLLAMDESNSTCNDRLASVGVEPTEEARRAYRELIVTTPRLSDSVSGAILFDETIRQKAANGVSFLDILIEAGITPGIKVDAGTTDLAGHPRERITEGLDGLRDRLREYSAMGARFAKWRAVLSLEDGRPTRACLEANANALALYAALCQEAGLVPIVEPEILMTGGHSMERCREATEEALRCVFDKLSKERVILEGMILKPGMVLPGLSCPRQESAEEIATATIETLRRVVPAAVPGIAFLSGGQPAELASVRLNAMNTMVKSDVSLAPWTLVFSFSRAILKPALEIWRGRQSNVVAAQAALAHRAHCNWAALRGEYTQAMERP